MFVGHLLRPARLQPELPACLTHELPVVQDDGLKNGRKYNRIAFIACTGCYLHCTSKLAFGQIGRAIETLSSVDVFRHGGLLRVGLRSLSQLQPALSAQLRQLRDAFGHSLLVPGPKGMTPISRVLALKAPLRG